jgi:hypothetical protein
VAERAVYRPHWTDAILDEMARNIVADGRASAEAIAAMRQQMTVAFPDARIEGYKSLVASTTNQGRRRFAATVGVENWRSPTSPRRLKGSARTGS